MQGLSNAARAFGITVCSLAMVLALTGAVLAEETPQDRLMEAVARGDAAAVEAAIADGADVTRSVGRPAATPVSLASGRNHMDVVEKLLAHGADLDVFDRSGRSPLAQAALQGNLTGAARLLELGADVNARARYSGTTALTSAAGSATPAAIDLLLAAGARIGARDRWGNSAFMIAAQFNDDISVAQRLLDAGADPDARDADGFTALLLVARDAQPEQLERLLDLGADPNLSDPEGMTATDHAARNPAIRGSPVEARISGRQHDVEVGAYQGRWSVAYVDGDVPLAHFTVLHDEDATRAEGHFVMGQARGQELSGETGSIDDIQITEDGLKVDWNPTTDTEEMYYLELWRAETNTYRGVFQAERYPDTHEVELQVRPSR